MPRPSDVWLDEEAADASVSQWNYCSAHFKELLTNKAETTPRPGALVGAGLLNPVMALIPGLNRSRVGVSAKNEEQGGVCYPLGFPPCCDGVSGLFRNSS